MHDVLGKIIIQQQNDSDHSLTTNPFCDSLMVGTCAQKPAPRLWCLQCGQCNDALVDCADRCDDLTWPHSASYHINIGMKLLLTSYRCMTWT